MHPARSIQMIAFVSALPPSPSRSANGDSLIYLLRDDQLTLLTQDHSIKARLVEAKTVDPDIHHVTLRPGDR